jgi:hypothetical protein
MTPKNFVSDLLEQDLTEAQPQTIRVGRTYQGNSLASSRVPFIRLAGRWLVEAGFSEGDQVQVSVARGEIRLRRQDKSRGSEESRRPDDTMSRRAHEESGRARGGGHARPIVTPRSFWTFLSSPSRAYLVMTLWRQGLMNTETIELWDTVSPSLRRDQVLALLRVRLEADDEWRRGVGPRSVVWSGKQHKTNCLLPR